MSNSESLQFTKDCTEDRLLASGGCSSFSSLSTLSCDSPRTILQFRGVPFSWEKLPGIPKSETQQIRRERESSTATNLLLPLPPTPRFNSSDHISRSRKSRTQSKKDPFLAAFVECCRDDNRHQGSKSMKMPTSADHRFSLFSLYAICKTCVPVADSIVYIPKSNSLL